MNDSLQDDNPKDRKKFLSIRQNEVILEHFEKISDDIFVLFDKMQDKELLSLDKVAFREKLKGTLYFWLQIIYCEAINDVKNLECALDATKTMVKKLKVSQMDLQAIITRHESTVPTDLHKQPEPTLSESVGKNMADKIDGFYSHVNKATSKNFEKPPKK